jgi:hypothetical protein
MILSAHLSHALIRPENYEYAKGNDETARIVFNLALELNRDLRYFLDNVAPLIYKKNTIKPLAVAQKQSKSNQTIVELSASHR